MAGYSLALPLGLLTRLGLVRHLAARTIEVTSRPGDPVQGDGDVVARLPATLSLADHPVRLVVPASP
jgi:diacylglycerol kinase family enzyme